MAQDLLADFTALHNQPANALGSAIAPMVLLNGHRVIKFPQAEPRAAYFVRILPLLYNGLGITVNLLHVTPAVVTPQMSVAFERHVAGGDTTVANFANSKAVTLTAPTGANTWTYSTLAFADGAEIGGLLALEGFRMSVTRVDTDGVAQPVYLKQVFLTNTG